MDPTIMMMTSCDIHSNNPTGEPIHSRRRHRIRPLLCLAPLLLLAKCHATTDLYSEEDRQAADLFNNGAYSSRNSKNGQHFLRTLLVNRQEDDYDEENYFRRKGSRGKSSSSSKGKGSRTSTSSSSSSSKPSSKRGKGKGGKGSSSSSSSHASSRGGADSSPVVPRTMQDLLNFAMGRTTTVATTCELNAQGLFGDENAVADRSNSVYVVDYFYQVSVTSGTTATKLNTVVVPQLDRAVAAAILSNFFDCGADDDRRRRSRMMMVEEENNINNARLLQEGTIEALSSLPTDMLVRSGLTCAKSVANSDCYIVQGRNTVVTKLNEEAVQQAVKEAVQRAMEDTSVLNRVTSGLVLDVTYLSSDLQTVPPIGSPPEGQPPQSPVASPTEVPAPTTGGVGTPTAPTMKPVNDSMGSPTVLPLGGNPTTATTPTIQPEPTTADPSATVAPVAPGDTTAPTGAPGAGSDIAPVEAPVAGGNPTNQTENDEEEGTKSVGSSGGGGSGVEWWAWLLAGVAGAAVILCCLSIFKGRGRRGGPPPPVGGVTDSVKLGGDDVTLDMGARTGSDPGDEQQSGSSYVPPGMGGTFSTMTSPDQPSSNETAPFVNNALTNDDDEEEEEILEETYTDEAQEEEGDEYVVEEEHTYEEDEDDEGSYYEEEEASDDDDDESSDENTWGNPQKTYGGRY